MVDNEKTDSQELCLTSHFGELEIKDPRGALQIVTYIMHEFYYTLRTLHYMISKTIIKRKTLYSVLKMISSTISPSAGFLATLFLILLKPFRNTFHNTCVYCNHVKYIVWIGGKITYIDNMPVKIVLSLFLIYSFV